MIATGSWVIVGVSFTIGLIAMSVGLRVWWRTRAEQRANEERASTLAHTYSIDEMNDAIEDARKHKRALDRARPKRRA